MLYMIHQPTENLVLAAFKKEGLKLPLTVLYILGTQYHVCITQQHTSYTKVVRWNFIVTIQGMLVTAGSRHSQSLQPMAVCPLN